MAAFAGLNRKQRADLLAFLQAHHDSATQEASRAEDRALFEQKCSHCHTPERVFVAKPDADTLHHIVQWMASFHLGWISDEDAERIVDYLDTAAGSDETTSVDSTAKKRAPPSDLYVQVCTACHSLERIFLKLENEGRVDWHHVVARMQQKVPEWIDAEEAEQILVFLQTLKPPSDEHRRGALSPQS
jgi:mono/diheme cytochrome c family protein